SPDVVARTPFGTDAELASGNEVSYEPSLDALTRSDTTESIKSARPAPKSDSAGARTLNRAGKPYRIERRRYFRIVSFFSQLFLGVIFWEVVIRRIAGSAYVARGRGARIRGYARGFRGLATEMGGVMIKLGQFVSSRVDVLPPEITEELEG